MRQLDCLTPFCLCLETETMAVVDLSREKKLSSLVRSGEMSPLLQEQSITRKPTDTAFYLGYIEWCASHIFLTSLFTPHPSYSFRFLPSSPEEIGILRVCCDSGGKVEWWEWHFMQTGYFLDAKGVGPRDMRMLRRCMKEDPSLRLTYIGSWLPHMWGRYKSPTQSCSLSLARSLVPVQELEGVIATLRL
jgi:hypothetical protein